MLSIALVLLWSVAVSAGEGIRYEIVDKWVDFASASADCIARGGSLALPTSAEEEQKIIQLGKSVSIGKMWLNLQEDDNNQLLTPQSYTNYANNEPSSPDEDCVRLNGGARGGQGVWNDESCSMKSQYACQYEPQPAIQPPAYTTDMGCWYNRIPQQVTRLEGTHDALDNSNYQDREHAVYRCFVAARDSGYAFFGVGHHGQCWAGHGKEYEHYGAVAEADCPAHGEGFYGGIHVYVIGVTAPSVLESATECEGKTLSLSCPAEMVLSIKSANYGRTSGDVCPHLTNKGANSNLNCRTENSQRIVTDLCDSKHSCEVKAANGVFGDSCHGTYKYLEVSYKCEKAMAL